LTAAVRHPERVTRLVLCDSACYPTPLPLEGRLALTPGLGALIFKKLYRKADLARYFRTSVFADNPALADEQYVDYYWERLERPGGRAAAHRALHGLSDVQDLAERPRRVGCPALVVWGERDRIFPVAHGERLARELPHGSLTVVAGAGHAVPEDRPGDFTRLVTDFLAAGVTRGRWAGPPAA
ncbi:MAG TPA: alpha/beta hydrolase, partial [Polyangia bacterium]